MKAHTRLIVSRIVLLFGLVTICLCRVVDAFEDPREAIQRRLPFTPPSLLDRYRLVYPTNLAEPTNPTFLGEYPLRMTRAVNKLRRFGTPRWNSADDVAALLGRIDASSRSMLVESFHPNIVRSQPAAVRNKQYQVYAELADWLHAHYYDLINIVGAERLDAYLRRFQGIRDLAQIGSRLRRRRL